jgi:hypothetical protein
VRVPPCRRRELLRAAPHRRHELLCAAPRPSRAPPRGAPHRRRGHHGQATRAAHRRGSLEPLVHGELLRPDVGVAAIGGVGRRMELPLERERSKSSPIVLFITEKGN